jgi:hypothetical protein
MYKNRFRNNETEDGIGMNFHVNMEYAYRDTTVMMKYL